MSTIKLLGPGWSRTLAALVAITVVLAGCVSAGTLANDQGASSLIEFRAGERDSQAARAVGIGPADEASALSAFRAGERRSGASAGSTDEASALSAFRAGERDSGAAPAAGHAAAGSQGRYAR